MTIETTSLALSKRLAALGVPQNSEFFRSDDVDGLFWSERHIQTGEDISVWTSGELGNMLDLNRTYPNIGKSESGEWFVNYTSHVQEHFSNEAEARGHALEYSIHEGIIKASDLQV